VKFSLWYQMTCAGLLGCWYLLLLGCVGSEAVPRGAADYSPTSSTQRRATNSRDWPVWRGPHGNNIAAAGQQPPLKWSDSKNVIWKTPLPGRGHASPTIIGNRILLATSNPSEGTQSVICLDRETGTLTWSSEVNRGGLRKRIHRNNTHASSTISADNQHLFAQFEHHEAVYLYALDLQGNQIWEQKISDYDPHYPFGFGASPVLYQDLVIAAAESRCGHLVAYRKATGEEVWRIDRNKATNYSSPIVTRIDGRDTLLLSGARQITALDPQTGDIFWSVPTRWEVSCGTLVWDGNLVFASGGFPGSQTLAVNAVTGKLVWENRVQCYEQSLLAYDGFIYALSDRGIAYCWQADSGQERWKEKLLTSTRNGGVSASPVLAGGHIYASVENGTTFVFNPDPQRFELIAENQLGDAAFATPTIVGDQLFIRVGQAGREWLYCIGHAAPRTETISGNPAP